jgi:uncharacterized protein
MTQPMNAVNWFEIPVTDLARAKAFYEHVLGLPLSLNEMGPLKMAWFPMNQGAMGATGSLVKAAGFTPSHAGSLVYFTVEDIEAALKRAAAKGGKVLNPKTGIGQYGFIAHFEDCEGNRVALHSMK